MVEKLSRNQAWELTSSIAVGSHGQKGDGRHLVAWHNRHNGAGVVLDKRDNTCTSPIPCKWLGQCA